LSWHGLCKKAVIASHENQHCTIAATAFGPGSGPAT
jgi:hypothetical protein